MLRMMLVSESFPQVAAGELQKGKGSGLGLSIAKSIIQLHGGTIGYQPLTDRQGSEFWFEVPLLLRNGAEGGPKPRRASIDEHMAPIVSQAQPTTTQAGTPEDGLNSESQSKSRKKKT